MKTRGFAPGFRLSIFDGLILAAGIGVVCFAPRELAIIAGTVVGHFFLFCNVVRMRRKPELIWAGVFIVFAASSALWDIPPWPITVGIAVLLAAGLVFFETRKPSYHGIGWRRLNPGLPDWWKTQGDC